MRYGSLEYGYAAPIADALATNPEFRFWFLEKTRFADRAEGARLLHDEMKQLRSKSAENWWRSHFTERCRCTGCSGQETDLLAIFEDQTGFRFAVHVEVKQPKDRFPADKDQAENYALRAECWTNNPPPAVLPHAAAETALLYSAERAGDYGINLAKFGFSLTFQEVSGEFPTIRIPMANA